MSEAIANAVRRMWFSFTNNDKAHNAMRADCKERQAVSVFQVAGASNDLVTAAKGTEKGAQYVNALTNTLKTSERTSKLLEWTGKGVNLASNASKGLNGTLSNALNQVAGVVNKATGIAANISNQLNNLASSSFIIKSKTDTRFANQFIDS